MLGLPEQRRSPGRLGEVAKQGWVGPAHRGASCVLASLQTGLLPPLSASGGGSGLGAGSARRALDGGRQLGMPPPWPESLRPCSPPTAL